MGFIHMFILVSFIEHFHLLYSISITTFSGIPVIFPIFGFENHQFSLDPWALTLCLLYRIVRIFILTFFGD